MGDEITYPFPNFNMHRWSWDWINNFISHTMMDVITYPRCLGLKLNHVSKKGPQVKLCHACWDYRIYRMAGIYRNLYIKCIPSVTRFPRQVWAFRVSVHSKYGSSRVIIVLWKNISSMKIPGGFDIVWMQMDLFSSWCPFLQGNIYIYNCTKWCN